MQNNIDTDLGNVNTQKKMTRKISLLIIKTDTVNNTVAIRTLQHIKGTTCHGHVLISYLSNEKIFGPAFLLISEMILLMI